MMNDEVKFKVGVDVKIQDMQKDVESKIMKFRIRKICSIYSKGGNTNEG